MSARSPGFTRKLGPRIRISLFLVTFTSTVTVTVSLLLPLLALFLLRCKGCSVNSDLWATQPFCPGDWVGGKVVIRVAGTWNHLW